MPRGRSADDMARMRVKALATLHEKTRQDQRQRDAFASMSASIDEFKTIRERTFKDGAGKVFQRSWLAFPSLTFSSEELSATVASKVATITLRGKEFTRATIADQASKVGLDRKSFQTTGQRIISAALCLSRSLGHGMTDGLQKSTRGLAATASLRYKGEVVMYDESPMGLRDDTEDFGLSVRPTATTSTATVVHAA